MKLTRCPYCGKKISYFTSLFIRGRGEYFCNKCKKESNIHIKKTIFIPMILMILLSLLILGVFLLMTEHDNLWFIAAAIMPFVFFFLLTPLFVELRPRKKHIDVLYDTQMVEAPKVDPDPTMAKTSKVVPAFVDDIVISDDDYKPNISQDVFDAIKQERKIVAQTDGGTRAFDRFEDISSSHVSDATMPVKRIKDIGKESADKEYDLSNFE